MRIAGFRRLGEPYWRSADSSRASRGSFLLNRVRSSCWQCGGQGFESRPAAGPQQVVGKTLARLEIRGLIPPMTERRKQDLSKRLDYVEMDLTGTTLYFGSPSAKERIAADLAEHRLDLTVRRA